MTGATHLIIKEVHRDLHVDAGTIAGFSVCIDRAAVPNRFQCLDAVIHDIPAS